MNMRNNLRPEVTVLCGLPGSGKTTLAEHIAKITPNTVVVSYSQISTESPSKTIYSWVYDVMEYMVMRAIEKNINVIIDDLNLSQEARNRWTNLARRFDAPIEFVKMDTSLTNCLRNVDKKDREKVREMYEKYKDFLTLQEEEEEEEEITINC